MDTHLVVLDPELLWSHEPGDENQLLLEWVSEKTELTFAVDRGEWTEGDSEDGELLRRYKDYVIEKVGKPTVASELMSKWLNIRMLQAKCLKSSISSHNASHLIDQHNLDKWEKLMVSLSIESPGDLCLLLVSRKSKCRRALNDNNIRQKFRLEINKLQVLGASDRIYILPIEQEENMRAHWFEDKIALAMTKAFRGAIAMMPTPPKVEEECKGDIDVWLYTEHEDSRRTVRIAECKFNANPNDSVMPNKVKQLQRRIEIIERLEEEEAQLAAKELFLHKYIVSNALDMTPEAWRDAKEYGIHFLRATLSNGYSRKNKWYIKSLEEFEPVEENGIWKGQSIRKYEL